jgi:hypothetical protein
MGDAFRRWRDKRQEIRRSHPRGHGEDAQHDAVYVGISHRVAWQSGELLVPDRVRWRRVAVDVNYALREIRRPALGPRVLHETGCGRAFRSSRIRKACFGRFSMYSPRVDCFSRSFPLRDALRKCAGVEPSMSIQSIEIGPNL